MVYISDFASFQQQGKDIFLSNPTRARFATKYRCQEAGETTSWAAVPARCHLRPSPGLSLHPVIANAFVSFLPGIVMASSR